MEKCFKCRMGMINAAQIGFTWMLKSHVSLLTKHIKTDTQTAFFYLEWWIVICLFICFWNQERDEKKQ